MNITAQFETEGLFVMISIPLKVNKPKKCF